MANKKKQKRGPLSLFEGQYFFGLSAVRLRRRLKEEAHAEVLSERSYDWSVEKRYRRFKELGWLTLIAVACVIILSYFLFVPMALTRLLLTTTAPSNELSAYKRTLKVSVNYLPAEALVKNAPVKELARGATYDASMNTDIFVGRGLQGIYRMDIPSQGTNDEAPRAMVAYRVINKNNEADTNAFLLFGEWPSLFNSVVPILSGGTDWYQYGDDSYDNISPALVPLLDVATPSTITARHDFFQLLLSRAIKASALQLSFASLPYKHTAGKRVIIVNWTLNPRRVPLVMEALTHDPRYKAYEQFMRSSIVGLPSLEEMTSSLTSLGGSATIGVWDHVVYESTTYFGLSNSSYGHISGKVTALVNPTNATLSEAPPGTVMRFTKPLERINAFLRFKSFVTSSTPAQ